MISKGNRRRALRGLAVLGLVGALGACDNKLLDVQNPGAVPDADLNDPLVQQQVVNTVTADFQRMFDDLVFAGALLSDEGVNGHNFQQWIDINLRIVEESNTVMNSDVYAPLHRARVSGEALAERLKETIGSSASSNLSVARMLAYAGYSNVLLGEYFCESPVKEDEAALTSEQILDRAIGIFDEAITVATAAKAAGTPAARADSVINLARVGAARAALWKNDKAKAVQYASAVPSDFVFWTNYSENKSYQYNALHAATTGSSRSLGVSAEFRALNDPRVRFNAEPHGGHSPDAILQSPKIGPSHSGWEADARADFTRTTAIRLASGLEAKYILAEAGGMNDVELLAFLNERRAVGNQGIFAGVGADALQAELRDQRRRDFFLDGHRLGDLRRYKKHYGIDEFNAPGTPHIVAKWGNYGLAECFVPSSRERIGNPSY